VDRKLKNKNAAFHRQFGSKTPGLRVAAERCGAFKQTQPECFKYLVNDP
jgi:hypothetical protein